MKKYLVLLLCSFQLSNSMDSPAHPELKPISENSHNTDDILVEFNQRKKPQSPSRREKKTPKDVSVEVLLKLIDQGNPQERKVAETQLEIITMNIQIHYLKRKLNATLTARTQKEADLKKLLESKRSHSAPPTIFCKKS